MQDNRRTAPRWYMDLFAKLRECACVSVCVCVRRVRAYNFSCMLLIIYCSLSKDFAGRRGLQLHLQNTAQMQKYKYNAKFDSRTD